MRDDALTDENVDWLEGLFRWRIRPVYRISQWIFHSLGTEEADIEGTAWGTKDTEYPRL